MDKILIVDNDANIPRVVEAMLEGPNYEFLKYTDPRKALEASQHNDVDLVITDLQMGSVDGLEVLRRVKRKSPQVEVLILTAHATVETAIEAMKDGAFDYLIKPVKMQELRLAVERALAHQRLCQENRYLKSQLEKRYCLHNIVGKSPAMQKIFELIGKVAASDMTVLVGGESGTGKELVAKAIHYASPRKDNPFVAVNCGAIPEALLESELFGHTKGAFTGAISAKKGLFEEANKGTIFLDEISATTGALQVSLLRVLEDKMVRRVGENKGNKVDVRVVAATNLDLEKEIKEENFRKDLYYRLSVVTIGLPPLRERKEDMPLLVEHFLKKFAKKGKPKHLDGGVLYALERYQWPGNVRELENVIERAVHMAEGDKIRVSDLPEELRGDDPASEEDATQGAALKGFLKRQERMHIETVLAEAHHDKKEAARKLGISLPSLYRKLAELGIPT